MLWILIHRQMKFTSIAGLKGAQSTLGHWQLARKFCWFQRKYWKYSDVVVHRRTLANQDIAHATNLVYHVQYFVSVKRDSVVEICLKQRPTWTEILEMSRLKSNNNELSITDVLIEIWYYESSLREHLHVYVSRWSIPSQLFRNLKPPRGGGGAFNIHGIRHHVRPIRVCFQTSKETCKGVSFLKNRVRMLYFK